METECQLLTAASRVYFRFRLFLVRGSGMSDVDDLLTSSELRGKRRSCLRIRDWSYDGGARSII